VRVAARAHVAGLAYRHVAYGPGNGDTIQAPLPIPWVEMRAPDQSAWLERLTVAIEVIRTRLEQDTWTGRFAALTAQMTALGVAQAELAPPLELLREQGQAIQIRLETLERAALRRWQAWETWETARDHQRMVDTAANADAFQALTDRARTWAETWQANSLRGQEVMARQLATNAQESAAQTQALTERLTALEAAQIRREADGVAAIIAALTPRPTWWRRLLAWWRG